MKLTIEINMDNAAFEESWTWEAARILRSASQEIEEAFEYAPDAEWRFPLRDINGNTVGKIELEQ